MSAVAEADALARWRFVYEPEPRGRDEWRSHYADVEAGRTYRGDCDDLGSTFLDLCARKFGAPLEDLYAVAVSSTGGTVADHFVGVAREGGRFFVGGDTFFPGAYPAEDMRHRAIKYRRLSEPPDLWRDGAPFE